MAATNVTPLYHQRLSETEVEGLLHKLSALGELLLAAGASVHEISNDTLCTVGGEICAHVAEIESELGVGEAE